MEERLGTNGFYSQTPSMWSESRRRNVNSSSGIGIGAGFAGRTGFPVSPGSPRDWERERRDEFRREFGESDRKREGSPGGVSSKSAVADLPLISTEVLDVASQRRLAFVVFAIIQGYKLYDLLLLKKGTQLSGIFLGNSRLNFVSKYLVIDGLFLYMLPSFRIPRLRFKPIIVFLQMLLFAAVTVLLSSDQSLPVVSLIVSLWKHYHLKDLTLTGDSVNPRKVLDSAQHFRGAHTIKILPENTAYLNPFHSSFCLPTDKSGPSIELPIRVNSSSVIDTIQLEFRDLYTNELELWNLTKNDLKPLKGSVPKNENDRNIHYFTVGLNRIGFYQLNKVLDTNGISLRIYKSQLVLPHCPSASIIGKGKQDRCVGDDDEVSIQVQGVPPLKLMYSKTINDKKYILEDSSLQPEYFESPLLSNSKFYNQKDISNLKWARSYPVDINLETSTTEYGEYVYALEKLVDGFGNAVDFSAMTPSVREKYDLLYKFYVHDLPRISLDEKVNPESEVRRSLVLRLDAGDFNKDVPFVAQLSHEDSDSKVSYFEKRFEEKSLEFGIDEPGSYSLLSIRSKHCSGHVIGKSSILISKPIPPQLSVKSTPILDQCVGQVGLNFDLTFTGVPPFYYKTKIYKIEKSGERKLHDTKKSASHGTRNQFSFSPTSEGSYEIVFSELSNALFNSPIALDSTDYTFNTTMRVKPSAKITGNTETKLCLGKNTRIQVSFSGEPPFTLNYDLVETSSNKRSSYNVDNIDSYKFEIETPNFNHGGDHILSLVSVKDSSGCLVSLSGTDAKITVRRDIPTASFANSEADIKISIKEASSAEIPLKLSGEGPFTVIYNCLSEKGELLARKEARFTSNYKPSLRVDKKGIYKLVAVRDQSCEGKIASPGQVVQVNYLSKPQFSIIEHNRISRLDPFNYIKRSVCQGSEETVDLSLVGAPPFLIEYEMTSPMGETVSSFVQVATKYASLKFPNDLVGDYTLRVKGVYDSNYGKSDSTKLSSNSVTVSIRQTVNPLPSVEFLEKGHIFKTCSANVNKASKALQAIKLKSIQGANPFSISFSIYHESSSKTDSFTLHNVSDENFDFRRLYEGLSLGNHVVTIDGVTDSNACVNEQTASDNKISISIMDVPKIFLVDASLEYCVGDYVGYQLSGAPPFVIQYSFNGKQLKSKEHTSQFIRYASEPGLISIDSIQDSSSQCVVDFTIDKMRQERDKLSLRIHPIPSVTVSQGKDIVQDIHEGDKAEVIFSFEGTPPFALTYVRTENIDSKTGKKPQIVETHKVSDIYTYEYRVLTNLQGTYEALEVSDAFCSAKNHAFLG